MAKGLDLNKIKAEIDIAKKEKNMVSSQLGESVGRGVAPRDEFLHGLITSLTTGSPTPSTNLIKVVENQAHAKRGGGIITHKIDEIATAAPQQKRTVEMSPERDEQLFADLEKKRKQTLAESIAGFTGGQSTPTPPSINYNGQQMLTSLPATAANTGGMQINEAVLVESVKQIVNTHLTENLGPVFEEAIKGTIIEMYAVERIKEVLVENKDLITEVVKDVIREIQERAKAKKPQH
jgi:hypothetical protein